MEKFLGQDLNPSERLALLSDNCDAIEEIGFTRRFTVNELNQKKEDFKDSEIDRVINSIKELAPNIVFIEK